MKANSQLPSTSSWAPVERSARVSALQVARTVGRRHLGVEAHLDVVGVADALDEVAPTWSPRARPPRTSSTTRLAYRAKFSTACPAEFAAPTT